MQMGERYEDIAIYIQQTGASNVRLDSRGPTNLLFERMKAYWTGGCAVFIYDSTNAKQQAYTKCVELVFELTSSGDP